MAKITTLCCIQKPHIIKTQLTYSQADATEDGCERRPLQLVVIRGNNTLKVAKPMLYGTIVIASRSLFLLTSSILNVNPMKLPAFTFTHT